MNMVIYEFLNRRSVVQPLHLDSFTLPGISIMTVSSFYV